jgi:long-chain fatty acid transport protein
VAGKSKSNRLIAASIGAALVGSVLAGPAQATEGYFSHGFGARNSALAGAGIADSRDAMAIAVNPAGLVDVDRQFTSATTLFSPNREYTATGTGFTAPGSVDSSNTLFAIPNMGYNHPLDENSSIAIALYGNGGMNTAYSTGNTGPGCPGANGVFCAGPTGVDLIQAFISVAYARRFGNFSIGVAPILAIQLFEARGLGAFAGLSVDPVNLTDNGHDTSVGGGVRVGVQMDVTENFRIGAAYQSMIYMSEFDDYAGLFAEGGDFDIPANVTVGIAVDVSPNVTIMADYKHIFYSDVKAIANSGVIAGCGFAGGGPSGSPLCLGGANGIGFGWNDVDIFKLGIEWMKNDTWTFRAGYAHNDNPIERTDVTFNILAPGVVENHITGGFTYTINDRNSFDFAAMFAPNTSVSGPELVSPFGPTPGSNIEISMYQYSVTLGWTRKFP